MQASGGGSISRQNKRACKRTQHVCRLWKQRLHPRRTLIQNFIEPGKEGDGSNGGRQNVADRLRQKYAEHRVGHDVGQNKDERDQQACPSAIKLCWQAIWKPMAKMPAM